ncbi:hypothetical protein [Paenibacillus methanolicus]|uniref:Uncharacterized protein n=1 Tax=Paenibacillus methanolicus TaxID=582686 RepID=A0A5S5CAV5_9BACL|nr:hypothetical protein [Paenibacillus methanolicus]TYP76474.1 hypothetical protein BCM02_103136 [Paenibacillus methanolicus]
MVFAKRLRQAATLAMTLTVMAAMMGCGKEEAPTPPTAPTPAPASTAADAGQTQNEPAEPDVEGKPADDGQPADEPQSLEQASAKDGRKFLDALKLQDTNALSNLMSHAENEYTEADMTKVAEGFRLYFDGLEELQLRFESSEQSDERYIQHYAITGTKDGKTRELAFQISYAKTQGTDAIRDDARREPLYDSPLISRYPYAALEIERYVQALREQDKESAALHLGLVEDNKETKATVERLLRKYADSFDLKTATIFPKDYDELNDQFGFELRDDGGRTHELRLAGDGLRISDDWTTE